MQHVFSPEVSYNTPLVVDEACQRMQHMEMRSYGNALFLKQYMYKRAVLFHLVALEIPLLHFLVSSSTLTVMFDIKYLVSQFQYFQNVYSILQL